MSKHGSLIEQARQVRKALVGAAGLIAYTLAHDLVPGAAGGWLSTALAVLAVFGIYQTPNDPPGRHAAPE